MALPRNLVAAADEEGRTAWLATLPATIERLARAWSLTVGAPFQPGGQTAWVAPEVLALGQGKIRAFERENKGLAERHDFFLNNTLRAAPHTLGL